MIPGPSPGGQISSAQWGANEKTQCKEELGVVAAACSFLGRLSVVRGLSVGGARPITEFSDADPVNYRLKKTLQCGP
jgi:hypothetical protein